MLQVGVNAPISIMVAQALQTAQLVTVQDRVDGAMTLTFLSGCVARGPRLGSLVARVAIPVQLTSSPVRSTITVQYLLVRPLAP